MHEEKKTHLLELKDNFPKIDFSIVNIKWENFWWKKWTYSARVIVFSLGAFFSFI